MEEFLPQDLEFVHDYCFFLHDQLVETLGSCENANVFQTTVKFSDANHSKEIEGKSAEELIDWFRQNGYEKHVRLIFYKQIIPALLSDFLHFVYEALECSKKGKLTVTYALLRKPLKDNLFYLEWLLAEPASFFNKYESGDPKSLLSSRVSEEVRVQLIEKALEKTSLGVWLEPQFLYDIRYSKKSEWSFENYFQKANHLVTTFRFLETEPENFNFIFSGPKEKNSQWEGLYAILPFCLFHAVQVVDALIKRFAKRAVDGHDFVEVKTYVGLLKWLIHGFWEFEVEEIPLHIISALHEYTLICSQCSLEVSVLSIDLDHLYEEGEFNCPHCNSLVSFL